MAASNSDVTVKVNVDTSQVELMARIFARHLENFAADLERLRAGQADSNVADD